VKLRDGSRSVGGGLVVAPLRYYLDKIVDEAPEFRDDGLSGGFPDWLYGRFDLRLAGRVHDWHYCTRAQPRDSMNQAARLFADRALRRHARDLLPWYAQIAPLVLYYGVRWGGGGAAFDSCGPTRGARCRHNLQPPPWFRLVPPAA